MVKRLMIIVTLLAGSLFLLPVSSAQAIRGTPGSSEFGFGASLDLSGKYVNDGIQLANDLQLDWVKIEIPWAQVQPDKGGKIDWGTCPAVIQSLAHYKLNILVSLTQPPSWALTSQGPDVAFASQFVRQFLQDFGPSISAIEIFPRANTRQAWGAAPDPAAYMKLWKAIQKSLSKDQQKILLVAGGLVPGTDNPTAGIADDLAFLKGLYAAGARDAMQVISIQQLSPVDTPQATPNPSQPANLRHYESVRQVMLDNGHDKGMIWITGLGVPAGLSSSGNASNSQDQQQADWLAQAFNQIRAQLYIGVAFLDSINPTADSSTLSIITLSGDLHPAFRVLRDQIAQNAAGASYPRPGRPKGEILPKGY